MKFDIKSILAITTISLLCGCSSNNIRTYRPDPTLRNEIPHSSVQKIYIKSVTMPENNTNSIMCRAAGNIYLPQKMTYSDYINDAFRRTLMSIDKLSDSPSDGHTLDIVLSKVTFNSIAGEWYIDANVIIDNKKSVALQTVTEYGTSFDAISACKNTAESFDEATGNFIKKLLHHPEIVQSLR